VATSTWIRFSVVAALCSACAAPDGIDVSPGEPELDDDGAGKADGNNDKAELKVTIDPVHIRRARYRLGLWNDQSETRNIWFFDTMSLDLYNAGMILRAREIDGDDDDSTVKLRPFTRPELDSELRTNDDMKCELDRDPDGATTACSLKVEQAEGQIDEVAAGERQLRTLFSSEQEYMFEVHGPGLAMTDLEPLGPIPARVWTLRSDEVSEKVTAELWYMPDGSQVLELSTKVDLADADDAMDDLLDFVADRDIDLDATQESKTKRALESFVY
jgi:hypothetical protein